MGSADTLYGPAGGLRRSSVLPPGTYLRYGSDYPFSLMVTCLLSVLTLCDLVEKAKYLTSPKANELSYEGHLPDTELLVPFTISRRHSKR